jgi:TolB-like protein
MADNPSSGVYEFAEFRLLAAQRRLVARADGRPIDLTHKAFDALLYLVGRPGELLDKATLLKAIWPNVVVEENNLNQVISTLRRALADGHDGQRFIVTVPGRGYQFVAEVRENDDPAAADRARAPVPARAEQTSTGPAHLASIAVLPFVSLSNDPEKDFFGDGIADELIHLLARVPGLKVPARTSSFAYKGRNVDIRSIAKDLGVASVLEGTVRSAGERIRVTVQLINAQTGFRLWSQSYDRRYEDIFKLQDELAGAILQTLQVNLHGKLPAAVLPEPPTPSLEAYHLFLHGRAITGLGGLDSTQAGIRLLKKAIAIDPNFGRAYAALARTQYASVTTGAATADLLFEVQRNCQRALEVDPRCTKPTRRSAA